MSRLLAKKDLAKGSIRLEAAAQALRGDPLHADATLYAGITAVDARRCLSAKDLLQPLLVKKDAAQYIPALLAYVRCVPPNQALERLAQVPSSSPSFAAVKTAVQKAAGSIAKMDDMMSALEGSESGGLQDIIAEALLGRFGTEMTREQLNQLQGKLSEASPVQARLKALMATVRVGVILPLTGRSALVGKTIQKKLEHLMEACQ